MNNNEVKKYDIAIIGAGIIGASISYYLKDFELKTVILEKNSQIARETSYGNSGVIHGGFDAKSNSINAKLNIEGKKLWENEIFPNLSFKRKKIDSVVLAFNNEEEKHLQLLFDRGIYNKVDPNDLSIIEGSSLLKNHPLLNKNVKKALVCKNTWAIDPVEATYAFVSKAIEKNATLYLNSEVIDLDWSDNYWTIKTNNGKTFKTRAIINAAGHYADVIAKYAKSPDFKLKARRGQYLIIHDSNISNNLNGIYFMVPTIHGKGVIVAPMLDGYILVGPSAEENIKKEDTSKINYQILEEQIPKIGHKIIPSLNFDKVIKTMVGSRPIDIDSDDFVIGYAKNNKYFINVAGTKSPGLSASPAIAKMVISLLKENGIIK